MKYIFLLFCNFLLTPILFLWDFRIEIFYDIVECDYFYGYKFKMVGMKFKEWIVFLNPLKYIKK